MKALAPEGYHFYGRLGDFEIQSLTEEEIANNVTLPPENFYEYGDLIEMTCKPHPEDSTIEILPLTDDEDDDNEDQTITFFCMYPQIDGSQFGG